MATVPAAMLWLFRRRLVHLRAGPPTAPTYSLPRLDQPRRNSMPGRVIATEVVLAVQNLPCDPYAAMRL